MLSSQVIGIRKEVFSVAVTAQEQSEHAYGTEEHRLAFVREMALGDLGVHTERSLMSFPALLAITRLRAHTQP